MDAVRSLEGRLLPRFPPMTWHPALPLDRSRPGHAHRLPSVVVSDLLDRRMVQPLWCRYAAGFEAAVHTGPSARKGEASIPPTKITKWFIPPPKPLTPDSRRRRNPHTAASVCTRLPRLRRRCRVSQVLHMHTGKGLPSTVPLPPNLPRRPRETSLDAGSWPCMLLHIGMLVYNKQT